MERLVKFIKVGLVGVAVLVSAAACAQTAVPQKAVPQNPVPQNPVSSPSVLVVNPGSLTFKFPETGNAKSLQTISIVNKGTDAMDWVISGDSNWITLEQMVGESTSKGTDVQVIIDITGMSQGDYTGILTIKSEGALNSPANVPVYLSIASSGAVSQPALPQVQQAEQTMVPSVGTPVPPRPSTSELLPVDSVYWANKTNLVRYASNRSCNVSGKIQNLDKIWYMVDVRIVTASGESAYITYTIAPGKTVAYNKSVPCTDQQSVKLYFRWDKSPPNFGPTWTPPTPGLNPAPGQ